MTKREIERRHLSRPVEWRAAGDAALGSLGGYAAVFNTPSQDLGGYVEVVAPGAFNKTIGEARVLCRLNHRNDGLLGTTEAGTLVLKVDDVGLDYTVALPDTTAGRDSSVLAQRGDLRYSSFAFVCIRDAWSETPQGYLLRTLLEVQLVDVAPVVEPAYLDSTTGMRSLAAHLGMEFDAVTAKPTEELRALLTGEMVDDAATVGANDAPPAPPEAPDEEAADDVEKDSVSVEPRDTHSTLPIAKRHFMMAEQEAWSASVAALEAATSR